jgi:para-nitrobenzyl esterase
VTSNTRLGVLLLSLAVVNCGAPPLTPYQVRTQNGIVEGIGTANPDVLAFLGIPYATPPVGALRWAPPQPVRSWDGVRPAQAFGDRCVQTNPFPDMQFQSSRESEDCLSLSIWTPAPGAADAALPVMVWIHGGGAFSGAGDERRHDGTALAARGVVLVHFNYRLGVLGFLAHPELTAESPHGASGNYGFMDQIAALTWVRDNIHAFGGDPGNVTIFGESAGSFSVSALMASPLARGLFHKGIGESGSFAAAGGLSVWPLADAEQLGVRLAAEVGAASLAALRATAPSVLVAAVGGDSLRYAPTVDGYVLVEDPQETYAKGAQHHVPLLAGWNSAERKRAATTVPAFLEQLRAAFPDDFEAARAVFPHGNDDEARLSGVALASDEFIGYTTWKWIELHATTGNAPVYRYLFDQIVPTAEGDPSPDDPGAAHATEIEYVFDTLDSKPLAWRDSDRRVADLMGSYWTNFAKAGDPNGAGLPQWPAWGADRQLMRLTADAAVETETHRARYEFYDRVAAAKRTKH